MKLIASYKNICKNFHDANAINTVLKDLSLDIFESQIIAIIGYSGSGKTTFLHIAGLIESQDSGSINMENCDIVTINQRDRAKKNISFVFQFHNLIYEMNVLENIMIAGLNSGLSRAESKEKAIQLLNELELSSKIDSMPNVLSGGERQRVAIARAFISNPKIIFADEPTGNLDPKTATIVMNKMLNIAKNNKTAIVIVTHNNEIVEQCDFAYKMENFKLERI